MYVHCANLSREFSRVDKVRTCVMFKLREQDVSAAVIVDNVCSRLLDLCCSNSGLLQYNRKLDKLSQRGGKLVSFVSFPAVLACLLGIRNQLDE